MSFVHLSGVGHLDPNDLESLSTRPSPTPGRPIDEAAGRALLATFGEEVERCVSFEGGMASCEWSAGRLGAMDRVREYADRLADQQRATVLEDPPRRVRYPPVAVQSFEAAGRAWAERREGAHERYHAVHGRIRRRDREIADAFNDLRRSTAFRHLLAIRSHELLTHEELGRFSPEIRESLRAPCE